ncbi:hypothetical protein V5F77_05100 [Xanthobacter sp. DSM 24535]|uniref:hypothetical protein n=1 Tax=Roseixanthobacter psychrophilus TaxID=3119917 RepID=UPI003729EB26
MADIARLGLAVDSAPVVEGAKALDGLTNAAAKAEKAGGGLQNAFARLEKALADIERAVRDVEKAVLGMSRGAGVADAKIDALGASASTAAAQMGNLSVSTSRVAVTYGQVDAALGKTAVNLTQVGVATARATANATAHAAALTAEAAAAKAAAVALPSTGTTVANDNLAGGAAKGVAKGIAGALGVGILSLISPVGFVTLAFAQLTSMALEYFSSTSSEASKASQAVKAHAEIISSLKDAYGGAIDGVQLYGKASTDVLTTQLRASMIVLQEQIKTSARSIIDQTVAVTASVDAMGNVTGTDTGAVARFDAFKEAIERLNYQTAAGAPDLKEFRQEIANIASADTGNAKLQSLAAELLKISEEGSNVADALDAGRRAMDAMGQVAAGNLQATQDFGAALRDLSKIALPKMSARDMAADAYQRGLSNASTPGARASADASYLAATSRLTDQENQAAAEKAAREAEQAGKRSARDSASQAKKYPGIVENADRRIASLQAEAAGIGLTEEATSRLRYETELLNAADRADITLSAAQRAELMAKAATMAEVESAAKRVKDSFDFAKGATNGFLSDLRTGLQNGEGVWKSFGNAAVNVLNKIVDKIQGDLVDSLFSLGNSGGGSGIVGLLGQLFGLGGGGGTVGSTTGASIGAPYATGGYTGDGPSSRVAGVVHGQEYVFSAAATRALGAANLDALHRGAKGYASGGYVGTAIPRPVNTNKAERQTAITFAPVTNIDARGSNVTEAQINQMLDQRDKALSRQVPGFVEEARKRRRVGERT